MACADSWMMVSPRKNSGWRARMISMNTNTEQDQPETEDQHQPDPSDTRAAAVIRVALSRRVMIRDEEQSEPAEQREQELEDEVERAFEQRRGGRTRCSRTPSGRSRSRS